MTKQTMWADDAKWLRLWSKHGVENEADRDRIEHIANRLSWNATQPDPKSLSEKVQQVPDADARVGGIVGHLKDCAEAAVCSGSDFNQGVVRGLEIAIAQIEGRRYNDRAFSFSVEDAEKAA